MAAFARQRLPSSDCYPGTPATRSPRHQHRQRLQSRSLHRSQQLLLDCLSRFSRNCLCPHHVPYQVQGFSDDFKWKLWGILALLTFLQHFVMKYAKHSVIGRTTDMSARITWSHRMWPECSRVSCKTSLEISRCFWALSLAACASGGAADSATQMPRPPCQAPSRALGTVFGATLLACS